MTATGTEARICELIAKRQELGTKKYGTTVAENPLGLVQWMKHFRDELLDGMIYVQRAIEQIEGVPSDEQSGAAAIRTLEMMRYTYHGAELWKPPVGPVPAEAQSVTLEDGSTLTATGPVQSDPHAELRKTWKPGQIWQNKFPHQGDHEWATFGPGQGIAWHPALQYRRHPDDIDPPEEKPWYPDDSGDWVERGDSGGMPLGLKPETEIAVLSGIGRKNRTWSGLQLLAGDVRWDKASDQLVNGGIVAYKVIK